MRVFLIVCDYTPMGLGLTVPLLVGAGGASRFVEISGSPGLFRGASGIIPSSWILDPPAPRPVCHGPDRGLFRGQKSPSSRPERHPAPSPRRRGI